MEKSKDTQNKYIKVFETFILKPIWLGYFIAIIFSVLLREWFLAGFCLLMIVYLGWIGGAIVNRGKTFRELSKGTLPKKWTSDEDGLTPEKAWHLGEAVTYTSYAIIITTVIVAFKYGYGFYISIPIGLVVWLIFREVSTFVTVFLTTKLK